MTNRTLNRKKERERFLLERFIDTAKLDAQIVQEREVPDFIVQADGALVGVEVTELFISHEKCGNTLQAQEAASSQIAAKAQRLYQEAGGPPAHVTVCFGAQYDLSDLHRDKTAQALCNYVLALNLTVSQRVDWTPEEFDGPLPEEFAFVHALGVPSFDMAHWGVARAGWVASLTPLRLQERIDGKAKRLPKYRGTIAENWLLIVADATKPSSQIEAKFGFDAHAVTSPFNRTFFYRYPCGFLEIGTAK